MVAVSLYRGNMHRVPDVPRRWLMPNQKLSLKDFKSLLNRRSKALSRLASPATLAPDTITSIENPNPNSIKNEAPIEPKSEPIEDTPPKHERESDELKGGSGPQEVKEQVKIAGCSAEKPSENGDVSKSISVLNEKESDAVNGDGNSTGLKLENGEREAEPKPGTTSDSDKERRKKEIEEKLQILNAKKHNLVQVLKQILNVEEELKRRSSVQAMATHLSNTLHVDVSNVNDSGSMSRLVTPRTSSEMNLNAEIEVLDAEDCTNQNIHARPIHRMSSTSPSSESPHRKPPFARHNVVPHPSRSGLATGGSPSRFAPTGPQGNPANLPAVSVSGTNYLASSPSPAASGGTSAFKDGRQPSPWN